jgi:hypothetical protein
VEGESRRRRWRTRGRRREMRKPIIGGIKECKLLKELVADLLILHRSGAAILISLKTLKNKFFQKNSER